VAATRLLAVREVGPLEARKPRLLERVREAIQNRHFSRRTEKPYVGGQHATRPGGDYASTVGPQAAGSRRSFGGRARPPAKGQVNRSMDKELPGKQGVLLEMYDERAFSRDAIRELPELATELRTEENLLHVQIAILGQVAREELARNTLQLAPKIFAFLEQALSQPRAISEVANAIAISFVGLAELQQTDAGRRALEMMPPTLKSALTRVRP
jgi:hypothetical protein